MVSIKQTFTIIAGLTILFSSCIGDADLTGFVRSTDRVSDRFDDSREWNEAHPFKVLTTTNEEYRLLVGADMHLGDSVNLVKFVSLGFESDALALVLNGDMVSGKQKDYLKLQRLLPSFESLPNFMLVGNHELYFDGWRYYYEMFGSSMYYFSVETPTEKDLYICLDTGNGTLGSAQLAWLTQQLETQRNSFDRCVVFTHVNFFRNRRTLSTNPLVDELLVLIDLFEKHRVDMVISGHDHERSINELGYTTYITMDALSDYTPYAGYLELIKSSEEISYLFHYIDD